MVALARVCFRLVYRLVKVVSIIGYNYSNGLVNEVSAILSCKCIEERMMNKIRLSGWDRMIVKKMIDRKWKCISNFGEFVRVDESWEENDK